jgi:hypothetical protein
MSLVHFQEDDGINQTPVSEAAPLPVTIIGLDGDVNIAGDAVVDATALEAGIGAPADAAWDGEAASASLIAIMKAVYAQNAAAIALLTDIETNTAPA